VRRVAKVCVVPTPTLVVVEFFFSFTPSHDPRLRPRHPGPRQTPSLAGRGRGGSTACPAASAACKKPLLGLAGSGVSRTGWRQDEGRHTRSGLYLPPPTYHSPVFSCLDRPPPPPNAQSTYQAGVVHVTRACHWPSKAKECALRRGGRSQAWVGRNFSFFSLLPPPPTLPPNRSSVSQRAPVSSQRKRCVGCITDDFLSTRNNTSNYC
jgi:hypothetical protein